MADGLLLWDDEFRERLLRQGLSFHEAEQVVEVAEKAARDLAAARALVADGVEAVRLTREYVGEDVLPAVDGWSWFDWTRRAEEFLS